MELSTLIDVFEDYLEEYLDGKNAQLPEVLPSHIVGLIDSPHALGLLINMGISCPYEVESEEYSELLRWLEISALSFSSLKRGDPQFYKAYSAQISDGLIEILKHECIEPEQLYAVIRELKSHQIPVSAELMDWLHEHYEPVSDEEIDIDNAEQLIDSMIQSIRSAGIDCAEDFVFMMEAELAMLPAPGLESMLGALAVFDWYLDAAVMLLSHHEPAMSQQASSFLSALPDKEWGKLSNSGYLTVLRHFVSDELKQQIDHWQRLVLRYHKPKTDKVTILEVLATMPDGQGGFLVTAFVKSKAGYAMWSAVIRQDMGIAESFYRPLEHRAEWASLKKSMIGEANAYVVEPTFIKSMIPWMLAVNQESQTPLDMSALLFLSMLPPEWAKPQPTSISDVISNRLGCPELSEVERARSLSDGLLIHPAVNTWFETSLPPGCKTPRDVINKLFLADRNVLAMRMAISGLVCHFAAKKEGLGCYENSFLLNAYDLLNSNFSRKKMPLLQVLAEHSLEAAKHQENLLTAIDFMAEPDTGYVLKIELDDVRPAVWRRMTISNKTSLLELHRMIQVAMGWEDAHLFQFVHGYDSYPSGHDDDSYDQLEDVMVGMLLNQPGDTLNYIYDFGDNWEHTITLEKVQSRRCLTPKVTAGSRVCPPEDCGGLPGYEALLKAYKRRNDDDLELLEWHGWDEEGFDPKAWDKKRVNAQLQALDDYY